MGGRDPRVDPKVGDVIRQTSGNLVRVTSVNGDSIAWEYGSAMHLLRHDNEWNLNGWRKMVAANATIVTVTP